MESFEETSYMMLLMGILIFKFKDVDSYYFSFQTFTKK